VFCTHVREDVAYGPRNLGLKHSDLDRLVTAAMALGEIAHLAERSVHQLSFGELKRAALAGLIAMRQPLMLLDETELLSRPRRRQTASAHHQKIKWRIWLYVHRRNPRYGTRCRARDQSCGHAEWADHHGWRAA
jgi:ABC-type Fe3+/spermidine/putrescine transport system ATPase subunit